jgi:transposase-like protein
MAESSTQKRNKAIALVIEDKLTPSQVARALGYTVRAVKRWVGEYLALHPSGASPESTYAPVCLESLSLPVKAPAFVAVRLEDEDTPAPTGISLEIHTRNHFMLRLQVPSVHDVALLLQSLETERC